MATHTAFAPIAKLDDVVADVRAKAEAAGATLWGRALVHLLHATTFVTFVVKRDAVTIPLAAWTIDRLGTFLGGVPADAVRLAIASFDGLWSLVLSPIGL